MAKDRCFTMIIGLTCWEFIVVMTVIVVLLMVPVVYWAIRRKLNQRKGKSQPVPPLMYITTVSSSRTSDVDIPHLPSPGQANFLPPSYEDIINGAQSAKNLTASAVTLNVDDELPEYSSIASSRGSMVMSTFYSDGPSARHSISSERDTDVENDSDDVEKQARSNRAFESHEGEGVFTA